MGKKKLIITDKVPVKPYTITELSDIYGVDKRTLGIWLKPFAEELGPRQGRYYSIPQVKIIFFKLGLPFMQNAA